MRATAAAPRHRLRAARGRPLPRGPARPTTARVERRAAGSAGVRGVLALLPHRLGAAAAYVGGVYLWHWPSLYSLFSLAVLFVTIMVDSSLRL